jgi:hypothetical protein
VTSAAERAFNGRVCGSNCAMPRAYFCPICCVHAPEVAPESLTPDAQSFLRRADGTYKWVFLCHKCASVYVVDDKKEK